MIYLQPWNILSNNPIFSISTGEFNITRIAKRSYTPSKTTPFIFYLIINGINTFGRPYISKANPSFPNGRELVS
jgi:hypothetical protein